jgi:hypothetical protein
VALRSKRPAALAAAALLALALAQPAASSPRLQIGIYDDAQTVFGDPDATFPILQHLNVETLRVNLDWYRVAPFQPTEPANPASLAYDWDVYDRTALYAQQFGIRLVFSIFGTPAWANGGRDATHAPSKMTYLRAFALAAARRYSGSYVREDGVTLPKVDQWMAWNEPNQPTFLKPQWVKGPDGEYVPQAARIYARMCNAVVSGVHAAGREKRIKETVACGVTSPRGNNIGRGARASTSPLVFLRAMKEAGAEFDVYAHHPYAGSRLETPTTPPLARTAVALGNIDSLFAELDRLYGRKIRVWITEYGYQTNPPDPLFGVSWRKQAEYLKEAYAIALKHPRIEMMLWFLLRDDSDVDGWQSGFFTAGGEKKPAYNAFRKLPR